MTEDVCMGLNIESIHSTQTMTNEQSKKKKTEREKNITQLFLV